MATKTSDELASKLEAQNHAGGPGELVESDRNPGPNVAAESSAEDDDPTFGVDERKLVRKLDMHLVPLVMLLYTFSFLDRYVAC
jgi:hypothetical protein